jgi:hypothetical protein
VVMSRDEHAVHSHRIKISNKSIERVEQITYLGPTVTNQILFMNKLRVNLSQGMFAIFRRRIFFLSVCYPKI